MERSKYSLVLFMIILLGCVQPTKEETNIIRNLNDKYDEYEFAPIQHYLGTHLRLTLRSNNWDSTELKMVYDSSVGLYRDSIGIPWVYLAVYDNSGSYLFTIVEDPAKDKHVFFTE